MFPFPPLGDAYYEIQLEQASARLCRVRRTAHAGRGCRDLRVLLINTMSSVRAHLLNIGSLPMRAIIACNSSRSAPMSARGICRSAAQVHVSMGASLDGGRGVALEA